MNNIYVKDNKLNELYNHIDILLKYEKGNMKLINNITKEFKRALSICLALNCVFEIVIVILLIVFVMKRMIKLNKILTKLMKFLD